jgi:hypothetical protein
VLTFLDCESSSMCYLPENLASFVHLKYLSLPITPECEIGMLRSEETLKLSRGFHRLPKEISKLRRLRHLLSVRDCL